MSILESLTPPPAAPTHSKPQADWERQLSSDLNETLSSSNSQRRPTSMNHSSTSELVTERGKTHGKFRDHAACTQDLKAVLVAHLTARAERKQHPLSNQHIEALEMIAHKIGRIIAGDPVFQDHWDDIAGYAKIANQEF